MQQIFLYIYKQDLLLLTIISVFFVVFWTKVSTVLSKDYANNWRWCNSVLLFLSGAIIVCETLLNRGATFDIQLIPFHSFVEAQTQPELYRSLFMNILLFVPLGLSLPYVLSKKPCRRNVYITIGFSAVLSATVEFLQYYFHLGRCETDDVIANTLGTAVGTISYYLYMWLLKNQEKGSFMQNTVTDTQKLLLDLCACALFEKESVIPEDVDYKELIDEAKRQTVFPLIFSAVSDKVTEKQRMRYSQTIAKNIRVDCAHSEIHTLLSKNGIKYVILKGAASASYYREPLLRMMGDVDFLVSPDDIEKVDSLLKSIGFVTDDDINGDGKHIGYKRSDGIVCEMHRSVNGVPNNDKAEIVNEYLFDIIDTAVLYNSDNGECVVPDKFHHGLILLLHTASHLTSEGIGLRHLCDWAVFINGLSNDEFVSIFEKPLKDMGLWRFAQLITLCCVEHLGCDLKEWLGQADNDLLEAMIADILNGGNFGIKDVDRYRQIKYIGDRKERTVSKKNPVLQLFDSINAKTHTEYNFVNKCKILLPVGWLATVCKYLYLVVIGKRNLDNMATISSAKQRKSIYNEFHLFK